MLLLLSSTTYIHQELAEGIGPMKLRQPPRNANGANSNRNFLGDEDHFGKIKSSSSYEEDFFIINQRSQYDESKCTSSNSA